MSEQRTEKAQDAVQTCEHHYMWHSPAGTSHSARICMGCGQADPAWLDEVYATDDVTVTCARSEQGVTLWMGDGAPVTITDDMPARDLREYVEAPLQRAIAVARLRRIADILDDPISALDCYMSSSPAGGESHE